MSGDVLAVGGAPLIELYAALAKAHGEVKGAVKDDLNPHYKHKYATLDSVTDAIRPVFAKHGLSIMSWPVSTQNGWGLQSMLYHSAGAALDCGIYPLHYAKIDAHSFAGAVTYARRQSEMAIANIAQTDDDGNTAMGIGGNSASEKPGAETPNAQAGTPPPAAQLEPLDINAAHKSITDAATLDDLRKVKASLAKYQGVLDPATWNGLAEAINARAANLKKGETK